MKCCCFCLYIWALVSLPRSRLRFGDILINLTLPSGFALPGWLKGTAPAAASLLCSLVAARVQQGRCFSVPSTHPERVQGQCITRVIPNSCLAGFNYITQLKHVLLGAAVCGPLFCALFQEGFSLIDSHKWLKIVRRADCLLLQAQAKSECRMFRVQFGGSCREEVQERCSSCVHKLRQFLPVQGAEEQSPTHSLPVSAKNGTASPPAHTHTLQLPVPAAPGGLGCGCVPVSHSGPLPTFHWQWVLRQRPELPPVLRQPAWSARELGTFMRLCLMDQHFPAFVEDVEKELHRLSLRNLKL
uniref:REC114 meiotic recombination protein n=1 Tax=Junco hyemalis TaxID=40217 RepID=A0A8C5JII8_JUNHY